MNKMIPLSAVPKGKHVVRFLPPLRVWERTEGGWISRPWRPGEKARYAREVLGQEVREEE